MIIGQNSIISPDIVLPEDVIIGNNVLIENNVEIGEGCKICDGVILCANSRIGSGSYLDFGVIIRENVTLGAGSFVGARCILGEYLVDFMEDKGIQRHETMIGAHALIRSGTIIYGENVIGTHFQTGHNVIIREKSKIGHHTRIGTLCDVQGDCQIGNYVSMHSNVHIGQLSKIDSFVWIYPYVVLTNDPTPPSNNFIGSHICSFAIVATSAIIMPGIEIEMDSLVAAGAIVTKDVKQYEVVGGNPAKPISDVRNIKSHLTGENVYPWRYHFDRGMPWSGVGYDSWIQLVSEEYK